MIRFVTRKYDGSAHWEHPSVILGEDECGVWVGQRHGWFSERPGGSFTPETVSVTVLPPGSGWVATFFPASADGVRVYVDIVAELDVERFTAIDMDLDVVLAGDRLWIDDEDEFEQHRVALGYPDALVARCRRAADDATQRLRSGAPPFDGRDTRWLEAFATSATP